MRPPCLVLENVSRAFGGLKAVDGVSLTVRAGERRAIIGPNGAGKTTLFNVISGEVPVTSGTVRLAGADVTRLAAYQRAALGIARTFQITRLFQNLTVLENVLLACEGLDRRKFTVHRPLASCAPLMQSAARLIDEFVLEPFSHELARNLAYGDQRKLDVALAMAGHPRLLLLDEPMAGLSAAERESMQRVVERLDPGIAVLLIEHDMDVAFAFADTVTVMYQGSVLTEGPKRTIAADARVQEIYLGVQR
jgi:branched-chain amino acid transport system ATP-binding protein